MNGQNVWCSGGRASDWGSCSPGTTGFVFDMADLRTDLAGPEGTLTGTASDGLLAAPGGWFGGGTSQIQRNIVGERILGLPREPKPD